MDSKRGEVALRDGRDAALRRPDPATAGRRPYLLQVRELYKYQVIAPSASRFR